ncbi:SUMF1/EgtB/PvdO family nonheme iron enzyme [bacterium]|nr:SUMF1/EgtB/PvdO family nonheme iron enzyme [bacterium]
MPCLAVRRLPCAVACVGLACCLAAATARAQEAAPDLEAMLEMVPVAPGSFLMGSPPTEPDRRGDETRHRVTLTRPFYIGAREVTQYLWSEVMGYDRSYNAGCADCPVENVTWFEAVEFCNRLSLRLQLEPAYAIDGAEVTWRRDAAGVRLPTEAEWEYVFRAGTESPFPTGTCLSADQENLNGYLPWAECGESMWRGQTIPVGELPAGPSGTYDMGGNVAEWCWDVYVPHAPGPVTDPTGPASGADRVQRGGAFNAGMTHARSAARLGVAAGVRSVYRGLRLALTPPPAPEGPK